MPKLITEKAMVSTKHIQHSTFNAQHPREGKTMKNLTTKTPRREDMGKIANEVFSNSRPQGSRYLAGGFNYFSTALGPAKLLRLVGDTAALRGSQIANGQAHVSGKDGRGGDLTMGKHATVEARPGNSDLSISILDRNWQVCFYKPMKRCKDGIFNADAIRHAIPTAHF